MRMRDEVPQQYAAPARDCFQSEVLPAVALLLRFSGQLMQQRMGNVSHTAILLCQYCDNPM